MNDARLATIRGLLAKAEATDFPAEAEAFTAKAAELMGRYAIDEAAVWATDRSSSSPEERTITIHRPYLAQKSLLVHEVATIFGCRAIRLMMGSESPTELVSVVGYRSDLDLVEAMVTSLMVQAAAAMVVDQPRHLSSSATAAYRRSHLMGFIETATRRLRDQHRASIADREAERRAARPAAASGADAPSMALVLADRGVEVAEEFRRRFPHVRNSRISAGSSPTGRRSGQEAGRRADLGAPGLRSRGLLGR